MTPETTAAKPEFASFFSQSVVFGCLLNDAGREIGRTYPEMDTSQLEIHLQLVCETILKHNLESHQLGQIDLLAFVDDNNSADVLAYFRPADLELTQGQQHERAHDLKYYQSLISLVFTRAKEKRHHDFCRELKDTYERFVKLRSWATV